ncbi:menaquinone-dependent protoporphyrinogen IX dehydrogenase [Pectobacteriaceae bacterium CE70]|uniref:Protoporphyrinogen IX dehydrogenase [quinone] n=1 Tax=Serratia sp. (strain ATCC 39006) TaxID=104623 RepID=A0A2I5T1S7_SERS3|nr:MULTISPECIES: menaquinone-dependent protoporphyrinogen IX dehydrogenase [Enterobacterales]WJV58521.1 menaquinone-dependent protoporphyrinogen IX dehydrogenase [Pectobacteriaceae bacterium C111]WJV67156.1 menaquinone-dependent protoporphyrinogen IX dehydrogenase [Pectobacteriaceae bacterium CE70]WJY14831.1 menaquinone-dependent protoporphyrinogen IX dehydrogenase [Pectobacteriaceae bacterium CE90]AUG98511.1 menaquinone-dependent protoporphyrinogen IX dehydrogenase [Serratia sp. ATCC 39006]AU
MKALILFSSRDGQTRSIASYIATILKGTLECDVVNILNTHEVDIGKYDQIMIGASIRYGHFHPSLKKFIHQHLSLLQQKPSAFFSVNLTARKPEKRSLQTNAYTRKFLLRSPWQPDLGAVFAGALRYPNYRWFDRVMIQLIMHMTGGETDSTKEIEYTDWEQVARFAQEFGQIALKRSA